MKKIYFIIFVLIISCNKHENIEIRKPFEVNHNLTPDVLFDRGYERIWGEDVELFGKRINDVNVYYQIDLYESDRDIKDKKDYLKTFREKGIISFKNYQKEMTEKEYETFKDSISRLDLKIIDIEYEKGEYFKDMFKVINLKTKDTFNCSLTNDNDKLLFESHITIKK